MPEDEVNEDVYDVEDESSEATSDGAVSSYDIGGTFDRMRTYIVADADMEAAIGDQQEALAELLGTLSDLEGMREDVESALASLVSVLTWKGTVDTVGLLPDGADTGDVYHVTSDGSEWAWDGTQWQELGVTVSLDGYYDQEDVDALLDEKADVSHNHTKSQITDLVEGDGVYYRVSTMGDTTSISGKTLTYPCMAYVTSTGDLYDIDEEGW